MNRERLQRFLGSLPTHTLVIALVIVWLVPTLGLLVTSFRPVQDANTSGWWQVFSEKSGGAEYQTYCAECHGPDGAALANADLSDPALIEGFRRSVQLAATFSNEYDGK